MKFNTEMRLCGSKFGIVALNSTERKQQEAMKQVSHEACDNYDIEISTKKTEVVNQPAHRTPYSEPTITVTRQRRFDDDKFSCLGALCLEQCILMMTLLPELLVSVAFGRSRGNIWDQSGIRLDTKLKVYRAVVLPTLLCM